MLQPLCRAILGERQSFATMIKREETVEQDTWQLQKPSRNPAAT
jgi:hypothetical protein